MEILKNPFNKAEEHMDEQNQQNQESDKLAKLEESMKDLTIIELVSKKDTMKKELDKQLQNLNGIDLLSSMKVIQELDKSMKDLVKNKTNSKQDRKRILDMSKKVLSLMGSLSALEKTLADKQKITKSLEKVAELSETIPVIEKLYMKKDY